MPEIQTFDRGDGWEEAVFPALVGGLVTDTAPDVQDDSQLTDALSVWSDRMYVRVDTGYKTFLGVVRGIPRLTFQFYTKDGAEYVCLITNDTFYILQSDEWQYVSDGVDTTLTAAAVATATALTVADITGFSDGDFIGIELDDGTQHQTTVNGAPAGSTINITDAMPSGAAIGNTVVKAVDLSGSLDIQPSVAVMPAVDWMIFTNGVDVVKRFDGVTVEDVPNLPSAGNTTCRIVSVMVNHLILMHTTEGGTTYPQRVRRSEVGDPTNWSTGDAGYTDLLDSEDFIVASAPLGPYLIIYKERTIIRMSWVGDVDLLFDFETMVSGEGALSQDSVSDLGDHHVLIGNSNFYRYRGTFDIEPIGDSIYYRIFGSQGELNPLYKNRCFSIYVEELDEIWFFYPDSSSETPNKVMRFRQSDDTWWPREFSDKMVGFGFYQATTSLTWQEAPGIWADYTYPWDSNRTVSGSPTTHLCGESPTQVYEYDYVTPTDNGVDIIWRMATKDLSRPGYEIRSDFLEVFAQGGDILVEVSIDEGENWETFGTIPASATMVVSRLFGDNGQIIGDRFRFRLSGTGNGFQFRWLKFVYRLEALTGL